MSVRRNPELHRAWHPHPQHEDPQDELYNNQLMDAHNDIVNVQEDTADIACAVAQTVMTGSCTEEQYQIFNVAIYDTRQIISLITDDASMIIQMRESPFCRSFVQRMRNKLPKNIRQIIYNLIYKDTRVLLKMHTLHTHYQYTHLLNPSWIYDQTMRTEFVKAWYESATFIITHSADVRQCLRSFQWSANIEPLRYVSRVQIMTDFDQDLAQQKIFIQFFESLSYLKKGTTVTIIVRDLFGRYSREQSLERVQFLYPAAQRMCIKSYKVVIRLCFGITLLVQPENITLACGYVVQQTSLSGTSE
ncbi:hypothetical protein J4E80_004905 [Alternaria sp. BMP 0032]|nr:hypothetical protein J4E80_004905 [Alternaria sp. BMP 0032]